MEKILKETFWIYCWLFELFILKIEITNPYILALIMTIALINFSAGFVFFYLDYVSIQNKIENRWSRIVKLKFRYKMFNYVEGLYFSFFFIFQLYLIVYFFLKYFGIANLNEKYFSLLVEQISSPLIYSLIILNIILIEIKKLIIKLYYK
ncbi:MAG: hypothetical protein WCX71_00995 [Candidatus Buchananbacteria bacterium]